MKLEVQFARESLTTLPSVETVFRIQIFLPDKKRRQKTPVEFGLSLKIFLGMKADRTNMQYTVFKESLTMFVEWKRKNDMSCKINVFITFSKLIVTLEKELSNKLHTR